MHVLSSARAGICAGTVQPGRAATHSAHSNNMPQQTPLTGHRFAAARGVGFDSCAAAHRQRAARERCEVLLPQERAELLHRAARPRRARGTHAVENGARLARHGGRHEDVRRSERCRERRTVLERLALAERREWRERCIGTRQRQQRQVVRLERRVERAH
eukprot:5084632-Prymnesium_polylepis.1